MSRPAIKKIISGGQSGADQAALDAAIAKGCPYGGWLPKGRKTENGPLPLRYIMSEMGSGDYRKRTEKNVLDSDGTLIVSHGELTGGSLLTRIFAGKHKRPCLHIDCLSGSDERRLAEVLEWLRENRVEVLNVAGPRRSGDPVIYQAVRELIEEVLSPSS
ncbi:putative molybdenum carrier protein [Desulfopila sp. IMCC35008]|uniref:putative molybdenum carrier protein n=1 Tax=Desulfopila sp. IMCC35008 TaxID=2653858 RepID=UPI0013D7504B|nr:putative molybdenum carrier protein [Desulfopila sp. IMCC35008]